MNPTFNSTKHSNSVPIYLFENLRSDFLNADDFFLLISDYFSSYLQVEGYHKLQNGNKNESEMCPSFWSPYFFYFLREAPSFLTDALRTTGCSEW